MLISNREDGEPCLPTEVRPICLQVMFRRIFESITLKQIQSTVKLHPHQVAFKHGYDTTTNLLTVDAAREDGVFNRIVTDYKEAYDSPVWKVLLRKLTAQGLPIMVVRLISKLMFDQMYAILIVSGAQVQKIRLIKCLFQGSLLSPILFNIYINDLLQSIYENCATEENKYPASMYADDLLYSFKKPEEAMRM
jgi:hypothetical protein